MNKRFWTTLLGMFTLTTSLFAASIKLSWLPPTNNVDGTVFLDLDKYKIYQGTASSNYTSLVYSGIETNVVVTNLLDTTYYFNGVVINTSSNESAYGQEITVPLWKLNAPVFTKATYSLSTGKLTVWWTPITKCTDNSLANNRIAFYEIWAGKTAGGPYTLFTTNIIATATSGTVALPANSGNYYFVLRAKGTNNRLSDYSTPETRIGTSKPKAIRNLNSITITY
jgi:hypothetical protein